MNEFCIGAVVAFAILGIFTLYWLVKKREAHSAILERIENEGGKVIAHGSIGMLVVDPFIHSAADAASHYFRVRYGAQTGIWFVRTSGKRPEGEWLWVNKGGGTGLPAYRSDDSREVAAVRRIPHWCAAVVLAAVVGVCFIAGSSLGRR